MKKLLLSAFLLVMMNNISVAQQAQQGKDNKKNLLSRKTDAQKIQAKKERKELKTQLKSDKPLPAPEMTLPVRIKEQ